MHMDYTRFRFEAVVDWIKVEARKADGSLHSPTIYDPASWAVVERQRHGEEIVRVLAIEVSVDAYSNPGHDNPASLEDLQELAFRFGHLMTSPPSQNYRFAGASKGLTEGAASGHAIRNGLRRGKTLLIGSQRNYMGRAADPVSARIYVKTTDRKARLPVALHRARTERTLTGSGLPVELWKDWKAYKFESMGTMKSGLFHHRRLSDCDGLPARLTARMRAPAERRERRDSGRSRRMHSPMTEADGELYEAIRNALKKLTRAMRVGGFSVRTDQKHIAAQGEDSLP